MAVMIHGLFSLFCFGRNRGKKKNNKKAQAKLKKFMSCHPPSRRATRSSGI